MTIISHLQRMFRYDNWANKEVLASLECLENPPERSIKLLGHVISVERLWLERITGQPQTLPVWPNFTLAQCEEELEDVYQEIRSLFAAIGEDGLNKDVSYTNSKGEEFTNKAEDILIHVIVHSAHHRGQIAANVRSTNSEPPHTDFIHGVRQHLFE
jgi:uncharacterized damage-inducible protein DinB